MQYDNGRQSNWYCGESILKKTLTIFDVNPEVKSQVEQIEQADIVIGIPSFSNEHGISHVVSASEFGLAKYFPNFGRVLLLSVVSVPTGWNPENPLKQLVDTQATLREDLN